MKRSPYSLALLFCALSALAAFACSPAAEPEDALPCNIQRIVAAHCHDCHGSSPAFGAPMSLSGASAFRDRGSKVLDRIHSDLAPMPPAPRPRLSAEDLKTLDAWLLAGAPAGRACDIKPPGDAGVTPLSCDVDFQAQPAEPFVVPAGASDQLICYGFNLGSADKRQIVGFAPRVDNAAVLHHVSLLQADAAFSTTPQACPESAGMAAWRVVYGWAPGAQGLELPADVGFAADPGAEFVVQLHYVNNTGKPQADASGFGLCTSNQLRNFDADIMAFGTHEFTIPPHGEAEVSCSVTVPPTGATTRLFSAFPHMHKLGRSISSRVLSPSGDVDIGSVANWNFDSQAWLPIDHLLTPGEVVETTCAWKNPNDFGVGYGPGTDDEMCYSFVMYYPRIVDPAWHWLLPALYSECGK